MRHRTRWHTVSRRQGSLSAAPHVEVGPGRQQPGDAQSVASSPHTPPTTRTSRHFSCGLQLWMSADDHRRPRVQLTNPDHQAPSISASFDQLASPSRSSHSHYSTDMDTISSLNSARGCPADWPTDRYCSGPSGFFIIVSLASASSFASFLDR